MGASIISYLNLKYCSFHDNHVVIESQNNRYLSSDYVLICGRQSFVLVKTVFNLLNSFIFEFLVWELTSWIEIVQTLRWQRDRGCHLRVRPLDGNSRNGQVCVWFRPLDGNVLLSALLGIKAMFSVLVHTLYTSCLRRDAHNFSQNLPLFLSFQGECRRKLRGTDVYHQLMSKFRVTLTGWDESHCMEVDVNAQEFSC